jgi:hypothetical protein
MGRIIMIINNNFITNIANVVMIFIILYLADKKFISSYAYKFVRKCARHLYFT